MRNNTYKNRLNAKKYPKESRVSEIPVNVFFHFSQSHTLRFSLTCNLCMP